MSKLIEMECQSTLEKAMREGEGIDRILESLSQINVNLEGLRVSLAGVTESSIDHETRLREIEQWKHGISPLVTGVAFLVGAVCSGLLARL